MFSALALLLSFIVGGITFLPLLVAVALGFLYYTSPVVHLPRKTGIPSVHTTSDDETEPITLYRAGWLTVRRTYEPLLESNGTYLGMMASGYRSFMDNRSRDPRRSKPKDQFYGVLKQNVLFLYDNEEQVDCWAAVEVSQHEVVIYPEGNLDGELFVKRNAITLKPKNIEGDAAVAAHAATEEATHDMDPSKPLPWFIFAKVNSDKEDWYHSLVQASKLGTTTTTATLEKDRSLFDPEDMASLVDGIDAQPDSIPMRWFNALLGRIFLAVYRTSTLEEYITSRIVRKLKRVKTPSILSEIQVREVNVGSAVPFFSKPMLKELTADGDASMEVHVSYVGDLRITIETVATINLGSRFKPYSVRLVLAVVLKEIEGTLLLKIKRPPSNRIWFGFSSMPRMVLNVEPVVSTRQIKWSMITSPIESRIREVIMESIVVPHMDDLSFFNSRPFFSRGGIWGDALRKEHNLHTPAGTSGDESTTIGTGDTSDVEEVASEPVPSAVGQQGVESTTSAKEASAVTSRARTKRRTSSEGERGRPAEVAAPIKSNSSTSSLSSFSLSSWRESRASTATASTSPTNGAGAGDKRRSWFGAGRSPSQGSSTPPTNASQPSLGRTSTDDSTSSFDSASTKTSVEDSASRLRDILSKRAQSRERERETRVADSIKEADQLEEGEEQGASSTPKLSGLSLTAPKSSSTPSSNSTSSSLLGDLLEPPSSTRPATSEAAAVSKTPLTESPLASVEALIEPSTQPLPTLPASQSHPSLSSVERPPSPPHTAFTAAPPPIPSRPSFTKTLPSTPPPPPRRAPTHQSTQSADSAAAATSASSLLSSWRTKAADKQALAAGVAQGKEMMKRWGATWNAKRAGVEEEEEGEQQEDVGAQQDGGRSLSRERRRGEGSPSRGGEGSGESYRDYRAGKKGAKEEEEATSAAPISIAAQEPSARRVRESSAASPPHSTGTRTHRSTLSSSPSSAGHFTPAAPSPTTKLSTAPTFAAGSPVIKPVSTAPARAYKPATMMAIPGIRDQSRRNAVASDHVSAEEVKGKVESGDGAGGKKEVETKRAVPAVPEPVSAVVEGKGEEVASAPASISVSAVVPPASDAAAPISAAAPLPPPPPRRPAPAVKVELPTPPPATPAVATRPVPPPPPPRTEPATSVDSVTSNAAPLTSTAGAEAPASAPLPAQATTTSEEAQGFGLSVASSGAKVGVEEDDELADEAGWGVEVDEDEGGEIESGSARQ